jgi:CheY-like chemotaxis protein
MTHDAIWSKQPPDREFSFKKRIIMQSVLELPVTGSKSNRTLFETVLIIEDHALIALDLEGILINCGVRAVAIAASTAQALELIKHTQFDLAFLDMRLPEGPTLPLAIALRDAGIPFAFATGFDSSDATFSDFQDCLMVSKPFSDADIRGVLEKLRSSQLPGDDK